MPEDNKSSNLIIFGIVAMFFAYLIYSSKNQSQLQTQSPQLSQPTQIQPQSVQPIDYSLLYELQKQTYELTNSIKVQNDQLKLIQDQQLLQSNSLNALENEKCSNIVSMNNTTPSNNNTNNNNTSNNNFTNQLKNLRFSNVGRENEELISDRIFGMK